MEDLSRLPKFLRPDRVKSRRVKKTEKRDAKGVGAKLTPGSGSGNVKGDSQNTRVMIESKSTVKGSYSLKFEVLRTLEANAARRRLDGVMILTFVEHDARYAVLPAARLEQLLRLEAELSEEE